MSIKKDLPTRKRNRLQDFDYSSCGAYFVTICTSKRYNYFWKRVGANSVRPNEIILSEYGKVVDDAINNIPQVYSSLSLDYYVIMPDHIHLLLVIGADEYGRPMVAPTIERVVKQLKGCVTKRLGASIWQKSYFDHIIRNQQDYDEHVRYILNNPLHLLNGELSIDEYIKN